MEEKKQSIILSIFTLRNGIRIFIDAVIILCAFVLSFSLRLGQSPVEVLQNDPFFASWHIWLVLAIQISVFISIKLYQGIWRFVSTYDLTRILLAVTVAIPMTSLALFLVQRGQHMPRTVFLIDWLLLIIGIGGSRLTYRLIREFSQTKGSKRVIIIGAGKMGEQLFREFRNNTDLDTNVVAIIDDNIKLHKKQMHGVSIMGTVNDLPQIIHQQKAEEVIIAFADATPKQFRRIVDIVSETGVKVKKVPDLGAILDGRISIDQIKEVKPEDLLGRAQVELDQASITDMVESKVVMVTGAGGSIGSELCRQLSKFHPSLLIFFEKSELFLYELGMEFTKRFPKTQIIQVIGNVRDKERLEFIFKKYRPQVIFHAAAYKHVPMMEENSVEAVINNVQGTYNVAEVADKFEVEKFVLVSTDKAVNPTNIMGTTKRVCEQVCQFMQQDSNTRFITVRFGNVLGSTGSVIPLFKKQIIEGGPVTVTHPEVNRYFMSIPEACQLVLMAGAIGNGGEVFVLEMGEPVKIVDLAREMIFLSGFIPEKEIKIEFVGLRPGEKLYEELLASGEKTLPTSQKGVRRAKLVPLKTNFKSILEDLLVVTYDLSKGKVQQLLQGLVPEYRPSQNEVKLRRIK